MKRRKRKATRPAAIPLPEHIAREIFKFGDLDGKKCHRMAYKVGHWTPDHSQEKENGGLCEAALASVIARCLAEVPSGTNVEVGVTKSGRIHLTVGGSIIRLDETAARSLHRLLGQRINDLWPHR